MTRCPTADVHPGRRELLRDLREPLLDEGKRAGLDGREDLAVRRFGELRILLVLEHVMEMAEGLLLRHDGDVILRGVVDERGDVRGRHGAARRCYERRR